MNAAWLAPALPTGASAAMLLLRLALGAALLVAGADKLGPQLGVCPAPDASACAREQRAACSGDPVCEGLVPARCADERRAACRDKAESSRRYFGGLRLLGRDDLPLPGGGALNLWLAGAAEVLAGLALVLGLLARPAAGVAAWVMAVAMLTAHWSALQGVVAALTEPAWLLLVMALAVLACGPGRASFDARLTSRPAPKPAARGKR